MPILYFVRHGETDWNAERRLQGQRDIPLNVRGQGQASACGTILCELFTQAGRAATDLDYIASPLGRARETMERLRKGLGLDPSEYRTDDRLKEMSFGRWEGFTFAELQEHEAPALAARERDKWGFVIPGGESYELLRLRVADWYLGVVRDSVVAAHGGVCRALIAHFGLAAPEDASFGDIGQGVVYVFDGKSMARYG